MARPRCERCQRPQGHCLCGLIAPVQSRTRVLILQHPDEAKHALNTARLAHLGLPNSELRCAEVFPDLAHELSDPKWHSCVLFPGPNAQPIAEFAALRADKPLRLVVPDGTWRKARKLLYLNPALAALPQVTLAQPGVSRYRLRKAPMAGALSTLEAIVYALTEVEPQRDFSALLAPFESLIEGQIAAMGQDVYQRNHGMAEPD